VAERDAFIDLVYQDEDLVRAEFDALVAAAWDTPPPLPPALPQPADPAPGWPVGPPPRPPAPAAGPAPTGWWLCRQRSPPGLHRGTEVPTASRSGPRSFQLQGVAVDFTVPPSTGDG